jgi:hypothetical protein
MKRLLSVSVLVSVLLAQLLTSQTQSSPSQTRASQRADGGAAQQREPAAIPAALLKVCAPPSGKRRR